MPYNIDFSLYVYVRNMEDGLQIVEQILPHFTPEFVVTVNFDDLHKKFDIPITLTGFSSQEDYEGDFQSRRSIVFTLNFSMKTYLFGPKKVYKEIRIAESNLWNKDIWDGTGSGWNHVHRRQYHRLLHLRQDYCWCVWTERRDYYLSAVL